MGAQLLRSTYSGTLQYTHSKFANRTAAVTRNTQRTPKAAATAPPESGPIELPRNIAEAVGGEEPTGGHDAYSQPNAQLSELAALTVRQATTPSGVCTTVASEPCPRGTLNLIPAVLSIRELHTSALWCSNPSGITI
jgi:hypothetical protein